MSIKVVLVDQNDQEIGTKEKLKAHQEGKLHRAISILIFNSKNELLLQKRAANKYHAAGLWSNTCCSHPQPGETPQQTAKRRLKEEMGIECELKKIFDFIYKAVLKNGLIEHEYDHVFIGQFDGEPKLNPKEVEDCKWVLANSLKNDIDNNPEKYTPWFKIILEKYSKM
jgi:isopentenyl-diphosphate delta-isomerase